MKHFTKFGDCNEMWTSKDVTVSDKSCTEYNMCILFDVHL